MPTVSKKALIERVSSKSSRPRAVVAQLIQLFLDEIIDELGKGNRLEFRDFGVFEVIIRQARMARNPKTMAPVPVPQRRTVKFKQGRLMRQSLERLEDSTAAQRAARHSDVPESAKPARRKKAEMPG